MTEWLGTWLQPRSREFESRCRFQAALDAAGTCHRIFTPGYAGVRFPHAVRSTSHHGLVVRTPGSQPGDRGFEPRWWYAVEGLGLIPRGRSNDRPGCGRSAYRLLQVSLA